MCHVAPGLNIKIPCFSILRLKIFSCQKCKQICGAAGRWFLQNRTSSSAISQWRVVTVQKFDDVLCDIVQLSHAVLGITLQWRGFSQPTENRWLPSFFTELVQFGKILQLCFFFYLLPQSLKRIFKWFEIQFDLVITMTGFHLIYFIICFL